MGEPTVRDLDPNPAVASAAARLLAAARQARPAAPVRDLLGSTDIGHAYAVQNLLTRARLDAGARIVGRKIGLTSAAVQQQLGVDQPDFGVLFDDMAVANGGTVDCREMIAPKVEAEVAFVLRSDLDQFRGASSLAAPISRADEAAAAAAVDYACAALEIVDSRIENWDIAITDTIADNASSGRYVLGDKHAALDVFDPAGVSMALYKNGERCSSGLGTACLGGPLTALAWLARAAAAYGAPLRAGDIVLSGALGPMVAVERGTHVTAELSGLGRVSATFA